MGTPSKGRPCSETATTARPFTVFEAMPNPTHTLILTECHCPAGAWNARNNRAEIACWDDNPILAGLDALRRTFGEDAFNDALYAIERQGWPQESTA